MIRIKQKLADTYHDFPTPLQKGKYLFIFCMIIVPVVGFAIFYVTTNINSILLAFQRFTGYDEEGHEQYQWGFYQFKTAYESMTSDDGVLLLALKNTLIFFLTTSLLLPVNFIVSYFLYKKVAGEKVFTVLFFLPHIVSSLVMVSMFKNIISVNGIVAEIIGTWGMKMPKLLTQDETAMKTILAYCIWLGIPGNMILLRGAMSRVSTELIDASRIDGCGNWGEMKNVILPGTFGTVSTLFVLSLGGIFTASGPILLFTNGNYKTMTIDFYIFNEVKNRASYELPSAVGLIFTAVALPITLISRKIADQLYTED